jgi:hypothetical protein
MVRAMAAPDDQQPLVGDPGPAVHRPGGADKRLVVLGGDEQHRHTKARHGRPGVDGPERPRPRQAHHPGHRRPYPGRGRQHRCRAHRRADEHHPVGAASAELRGRRGHVPVGPPARSGPWPGVAEPSEVEGERLVALLGELLGAWKPFAEVPAASVGGHQPGGAVADDDPDQHRPGRGAEPERPGRAGLAQARLGETTGGCRRGDARSLAALVPPVAGAAEQHHAEEQPCQAVLADPSHVSYETRPAGNRATWNVPMVLP